MSDPEVHLNTRGCEPMDAKTAGALGRMFESAHKSLNEPMIPPPSELLPCPFCWSEARRSNIAPAVVCTGCGVTGPTTPGNTTAEAFMAWNRRPGDPETCPKCEKGELRYRRAYGELCCTTTGCDYVRNPHDYPTDADAQLADIRDLLTPLLGTEVCAARGPHHDDPCVGGRVQCSNAQFTEDCRACNGTGRRNIADGLSVVECVKRLETMRSNSAHQANVFEVAASEAFASRDELREQVKRLRTHCESASKCLARLRGESGLTYPYADIAGVVQLQLDTVLAETAPKEPAK